MPGFDGTGPLGKGPMTGNGNGFCILKAGKEKPEKIEGYSGLQGRYYLKGITNPGPVNKRVSGPDADILNHLHKGGGIMPLGDGTGPAGLGPMTGRAGGFCAGYPVPGYMNAIPGRGFRTLGYGSSGRGGGFFGRGNGRGRGRGRGRGMGFRTMGRIPYQR